jgi:hypothetical protein
MRRYVQWFIIRSYNWNLRREKTIKIKPRLWFMMRAVADDCPALFYRIANLNEEAKLRRQKGLTVNDD